MVYGGMMFLVAWMGIWVMGYGQYYRPKRVLCLAMCCEAEDVVLVLLFNPRVGVGRVWKGSKSTWGKGASSRVGWCQRNKISLWTVPTSGAIKSWKLVAAHNSAWRRRRGMMHDGFAKGHGDQRKKWCNTIVRKVEGLWGLRGGECNEGNIVNMLV